MTLLSSRLLTRFSNIHWTKWIRFTSSKIIKDVMQRMRKSLEQTQLYFKDYKSRSWELLLLTIQQSHLKVALHAFITEPLTELHAACKRQRNSIPVCLHFPEFTRRGSYLIQVFWWGLIEVQFHRSEPTISK